MVERILNWFTVEPTVGILMITTAIVIFGSAFRAYKESSGKFWPGVQKVLEATIGVLLFIGLLWAFRIILNDNVSTFYSTHGSLSDLSRSSAWSIWGRPHTQEELSVTHYRDVEVQEEIPCSDESEDSEDKEKTIVKTKIVQERVEQNSYQGFVGNVHMSLSEREKGYALYSGYTLDVDLQYDIVNDSDYVTEAEFVFPLSQGQTLFENFYVKVDGKDISSELRYSPNLVSWEKEYQPHQTSKITIHYTSRGMDYFYYQIPIQREINDFELTLTIDKLPVSLLNYPDGVITPTSIQPTDDDQGSILKWNLDHAITVAGMGVSLLQPEQPGAQVLRVLVISPYALTLLGAMLALTMLIWGMNVRFLDLALLTSIYSMEFLLMAGVSDYFLGFWGSLILGAGMTLFLSYLLFRNLPSKTLRIIIYILVGFFTIIYPLSGLLTDLLQQNSFNNLMQVGLIIYITCLTLFFKKQKKEIDE